MTAHTTEFTGELVDAEQFFAPASTDLVDGLIGQYKQARARVEKVAEIMGGELGGVVGYFIDGNKTDRDNWYRLENLFAIEGAIAHLNADYWNRTLQLTDVLNVMPEKRREEWREQIRNPLGKKRDKYANDYILPPLPDFTEETVRSTIGELLAMRGKFFAERVDGIFRALSGEHVTNRPEGFGKRMILNGITNWYGGTERIGYINDLRCVVAKFMGRDEPKWNSSSSMVSLAKQRHGQWITLDGGALRIRCYLKGTAHLEVHPDMAWRLNGVLASLYPLAIPPQFRSKPKTKPKEFGLMQKPLPFAVVDLLAGMKQATSMEPTGDFRRPYNHVKIPNGLAFEFSSRDADKHTKAEAERVLESIGGVKQADGHFVFDYHPNDVLDDIVCSGCVPDHKSHQFYPTPASVAAIAVEMADIGPDDLCLEPSAGQGGLADFMPKDRTRCVEISELHANILSAKGFPMVSCADFLAWANLPGHAGYDRVVMNPPFDQGRWLAHLNAAASLVRSGGRLVAILPASARGKDLLPGWSLEWSGTISNEFAGTTVSVVILAATPLTM